MEHAAEVERMYINENEQEMIFNEAMRLNAEESEARGEARGVAIGEARGEARGEEKGIKKERNRIKNVLKDLGFDEATRNCILEKMALS